MKKNLTLDANAELISALGKKVPDKTRFRSVINLYDEEVKKSNDRASAYARRAIALSMGVHNGDLDKSDIKKCRSDIDEAMKINKELTVVQIADGCYHYYCMKDFKKAIASFNIAMSMDPSGYKARFYLAMVYKTMGKWDDMELMLNEIVKFKMRNHLGLTNIGLCYDYLHEFDKALEYHQKAIDAEPGWPASYMNKFYTLILKGNTAEARAVIEELIKITHEEPVEYQITLDIYEGKYKDALNKTLKANPDDFSDKGEQYLYLGNIYLLLDDKINAEKNLDKALEEFSRGKKADPGNAEIHFLTGMAHALRGNKSQAVAEGEEAFRIAETSRDKILESEMLINLARIYAQVGMHKEAFKDLDDSLRYPSLFSTKILQMDPVWKPLHSSTEFKTLIARYDK